ncbi:N-acetylmuramoyl-L-alanine amidase [Luteolibacter flavescens]|uniref:N-acetylmuramoyl-L-alanine amidase n=1 Tax=Luteolibacter flavescens TaxID=1859460 RepID=A0ABT3FMB2_9BACT|nr:N-acetylmuramoyl-L-alanine amidase [Luteolibacter flavescens]MCW1884698.1 N-acetylmuramoyl-L-alanine amidase [Luteolibacter flavescens]
MTSRSAPLWIALFLALAAALWWWHQPAAPVPVPAPPPPVAPAPSPLSDLAVVPDWASLNRYQSTITRGDFLRLMDTVFTVSPAWREWIEVGEEEANIRTTGSTADGDSLRLRFAPDGLASTPPRYWRSATELPPAPPARPLEGLRIAIDPGHIGGRWGKMEERWFQIPGSQPVQEGDMTLQVAKLLKPRLEALGATVTLVREETEPVTPVRPDMLEEQARASSSGGDIVRLAERLFYRTAEIRARARVVNDTIRPDLVLCLHFNADAWGDPAAPSLVPTNHFHMLLNGGYMDNELAKADERYDLLTKLLQGVHDEERKLAASTAAAFVERNPMPPYLYNPAARNHRNVDGNPYLWARNLLANRTYHCPVVYYEPYVMNSTEDHARIQAGDYEGEREVWGKPRPSIFREYADSAARGLENYYRHSRKMAE